MPSSIRLQINSDIWNWAINEGQLDFHELKVRYPRIEDWISGNEQPTFKQVEQFSKHAKIPFGYMFLKTPPPSNTVEIEYRSINNKLPEISKNLKDTIFEMDYKREWMRDYRKSMGWDKIDALDAFEKNTEQDIRSIADIAKELLGLEEKWYKKVKDTEAAFKYIRNKMENIGILVMQNGVVGMNNYRKLDINEFRAFLLYDDIAPIIFLNSLDSKTGRIFSLIHEYIHFLYKQEDVLVNEKIENDIKNERWINKITAEILMPSEDIKKLWNSDQNAIHNIIEVSKIFKVSQLALAIKLKSMDLIGNDTLEEIKSLTQEALDKKDKSGDGGNFYNTYLSRVSPTFTKAVIRGAEMQEVSYTYAFRLLGGIKGKTYDNIKEELLRYG